MQSSMEMKLKRFNCDFKFTWYALKHVITIRKRSFTPYPAHTVKTHVCFNFMTNLLFAHLFIAQSYSSIFAPSDMESDDKQEEKVLISQGAHKMKVPVAKWFQSHFYVNEAAIEAIWNSELWYNVSDGISNALVFKAN